MRLLVLGGTAWLGHTIASVALMTGHEVTCLARGTAVPDGARLVRADRDNDDALSPVRGEHWDAVIDVSRQPGQVRRAVRDLESVAERYLFVSSGNAYASQEALGADEDAPRMEPLAADAMERQEDYGPAKVACENVVLEGFGADRTVIARAGLIGGPGDDSGRSVYWPWRFSEIGVRDRPGAVLVPDLPELPAAIIDVRDLAGWLVRLAGAAAAGVFNATGTSVPFPEYIETVRRTAGHSGSVVLAPQDWLIERGVNEWSGPRSMPLWLADRSWYGMNARSNARALAAGLTLRPLADSIRDTVAWVLATGGAKPAGAGLTGHEERELLDQLD